ncbi:MAG: tetratricopeptide repeat protein, partial [Candidatus Omnitrophota bacterium]
MKKTLFFLLVLLFIIPCLSANAIEEHFRSEIDFAKKAIRDGFYDVAENRLSVLLNANIPRQIGTEAHLLLGRIYYEKSLPQKALSEFNFVLDRYKESGFADQATYWIAEVYFTEGHFEQALVYYQDVIEDYPSSKYVPYSLFSQAWCYEKMGEYGTATDILRENIQKYPNSELAVRSRYKVAEILYKSGRYGNAASDL